MKFNIAILLAALAQTVGQTNVHDLQLESIPINVLTPPRVPVRIGESIPTVITNDWSIGTFTRKDGRTYDVRESRVTTNWIVRVQGEGQTWEIPVKTATGPTNNFWLLVPVQSSGTFQKTEVPTPVNARQKE